MQPAIHQLNCPIGEVSQLRALGRAHTPYCCSPLMLMLLLMLYSYIWHWMQVLHGRSVSNLDPGSPFPNANDVGPLHHMLHHIQARM